MQRRCALLLLLAIAQRPVADVDAYVRALPNWQRMIPDGTHPGAELHAMISANVLVPAVVPLVAKLRCEVQPDGV
jgi:hypothetical protein